MTHRDHPTPLMVRAVGVPPTRADCPQARPCTYLACRYNLVLEAAPASGESCALDVADRGDHSLAEVGEILGVTRERIRQIEAGALDKIRRFRREYLDEDEVREYLAVSTEGHPLEMAGFWEGEI